MTRSTLMSTATAAAFAAMIAIGPIGVSAQTGATTGTTTTAPAASTSGNTQSAMFREIEDDDMIVPPFNLTVDQLDDMHVYGAGDEDIGEIDEVLMDASGKPVAVTVGVGGFLGIGDTEVIMSLDQLTMGDKRFSTTLTKEQIEKLPKWDD